MRASRFLALLGIAALRVAARDELLLGKLPGFDQAPAAFGGAQDVLGALDGLSLANVSGGLFERQTGSACCADGSCCEPGNTCMIINGANACCPLNYETCGGTMCGNPGSTCCSAGAACGPDQGPCCGQGCCGVSQSCCAGGCCDPGKVCCSTGCCDEGQHCCNGAGSERCCDSDAPCCGGVCCPTDRECCGDVCCETGFYCKTRGTCAERVTSVFTTATERVVTVTESPDHAPTGMGRELGWKVAGAAAVLIGL